MHSLGRLLVPFLIIMLSTSVVSQTLPEKESIGQFIAPSCERIAAAAGSFARETVRKTTGYYTPLFLPGPDGKLRPEDRKACLVMEGSCIVGNYLYNADAKEPYDRNRVAYKFGMGSGKSVFNQTNALDPCRTVAADLGVYKPGTVVYMPAMKGKICPQSDLPVDGCFIVGDKGAAIKGTRRFDMFSGECRNYRKDISYCMDAGSDHFEAPAGTPYWVLPRTDPLAAALRAETNAFIGENWGRH